MALVGQLAVNLTARTKRFERGMQRSRRETAHFRDTLGGARRSLMRFAGIMGVALGGAAIVAGLRRQAQLMDSTSKYARTLGITTEALAGYQHAANLSGASTEGLHRALARMTREAPGKTLEDIADEMKAMPSASDRAERANEVFGRRWQELMPLLLGGAEGIQKLRKEALALGLVFSSDTGESVELMNDSFSRFWSVVKGGAQSIVGWLAPGLTKVANMLTKFAIGLREVSRRIIERIADSKIVNRVGEWGKAIASRLATSVSLWIDALLRFDAEGGIDRMFASIVRGAAWVVEAIGRAATAVSDMTAIVLRSAAKAQKAWLRLTGWSEVADAREEMQRWENQARQAQSQIERFGETMSPEGVEELKEYAAHSEQMAAAVRSRFEQLQQDMQDFEAGGKTSLERLADMMDGTLGDQIVSTAKELRGMADGLEENAKPRLEGLADWLEGFQGNLAGIFTDIDWKNLGADSAEDFFDQFDEGIDGIGSRLAKVSTPAALERGTAEAWTAGAQAQAQAQALRDIRRDQAQAAKDAKKQRDEQIEAQERTADALESGVALGGI